MSEQHRGNHPACSGCAPRTIQEHLSAQDKKLDRILTYLEGDDLDPGKPGIKVRLDRIEQFIAVQKKVIWGVVTVLVGSIVTFAVAIFRGQK